MLPKRPKRRGRKDIPQLHRRVRANDSGEHGEDGRRVLHQDRIR
nr:MAG TPA: hypothetical protein [Caudoviricetes sp.]